MGFQKGEILPRINPAKENLLHTADIRSMMSPCWQQDRNGPS